MTPPTIGQIPLDVIHPLPWKIFQEPAFRGGEIKITDSKDMVVFGEGSFGQEAKFYGLIVQAVNTHAAALECVEALEDYLAAVSAECLSDLGESQCAERSRLCSYCRLKAALAKWEEANK